MNNTFSFTATYALYYKRTLQKYTKLLKERTVAGIYIGNQAQRVPVESFN